MGVCLDWSWEPNLVVTVLKHINKKHKISKTQKTDHIKSKLAIVKNASTDETSKHKDELSAGSAQKFSFVCMILVRTVVQKYNTEQCPEENLYKYGQLTIYKQLNI